MEDLKLTDLINVGVLQSLQDTLAKASGMSAVIVDSQTEITKISNTPQFCTRIFKASPRAEKLCQKCSIKAGCRVSADKAAEVPCYAGLVSACVPIMFDGRQFGTVVTGRVFTKAPDEDKSKETAEKLGINEEEYADLLSRVNTVSKSQLDSAAHLLADIVREFLDQSTRRMQFKDTLAKLISEYQKLSDELKNSENSLELITENSEKLKSNFEILVDSASKSNNDVEKTNSVLKHIKDVSEQTRILGFNASIEAARSGAAGAGFNVIAQEVRRLADDSEKYTENINSALADLKASIAGVKENVDEIFGSMDESEQTAKNFAAAVNALQQEADSIDSICKNIRL